MLALVRRGPSVDRSEMRQIQELGVSINEFDAECPHSIEKLLSPSDILLEMANLRIADVLLPVAQRAGWQQLAGL